MTQSASPNEPVNASPPDANTTSSPVGQTAEKPPEPQPTAPPSPAATNTQTTTIHEARGEKFNFANAIQDVTVYLDSKHGLSNIVLRSFAFNEIWRITKEREEEIAGLFVADPLEVESLRRVLVEKRVLILSGESGIGKATTAIYLGSLVAEHATDGEAEAVHETFLIPTLERYDKIDLNEICEGGDAPGNRFMIFKNALTRCNHDLLRFLGQLNEYILGQLADRLREDNSYLIFTISPSEAAQLQPKLGDKDIHHELKHPSDELLSKGLERQLTQLARSPQIAAERLKQLQEPDQQKILISSLKTMPRIAGFAKHYLRDSGATEVELDLGEAIRRFEDITYWFHQELIGDFESWCFTLSLGLAHCLGHARGVSWIDFESLRRAVWQCFKRDPELFPHRLNSNDQPPGEFPEKPPPLRDDIYLEKSCARILKDPNGLADLIHFNEDSYSLKLWEILLRHHRRILALLLQRLCEMVEDHSEKYHFRQRALYAGIIGRIGEIDPDRVSLALVERWIDSDDVRDRASIGALYQGILASRDERYRNAFLDLLASLSVSDTSSVDPREGTAITAEEKNRLLAARAEEKNRLLTAISVYSQLGSYDLSLAVKGLERIAQDKLVPVLQEVQRVGRLIERTQNAFSQQTSAEDAIELWIYQDMLSDLAARLYAQQGHIFVGVQYALCSLSLNTDPIIVFKELRYWIESSGQATGALVALMFLTKDGIAATLESRQIEISTNELATAERKTCNPIIVALTSGQESVLEMARFLVTIFESFSIKFIFPKEFMRYLRESFLFHLQLWIEEALPIESCRKATENLFTELMHIHQGVLFEPIYQLLNNPRFSKKDRDLKKLFIDEVLWQRH